MYSFDFIKMSPNRTFVVSEIPSGVFCRRIGESGKQYPLYRRHGTYKRPENPAAYVVTPGSYVEHLMLNLPGGSYKADWVDPASGSVTGAETFIHQGGDRMFTVPNTQWTPHSESRVSHNAP